AGEGSLSGMLQRWRSDGTGDSRRTTPLDGFWPGMEHSIGIGSTRQWGFFSDGMIVPNSPEPNLDPAFSNPSGLWMLFSNNGDGTITTTGPGGFSNTNLIMPSPPPDFSF